YPFSFSSVTIYSSLSLSIVPLPLTSRFFPYTTLFRSLCRVSLFLSMALCLLLRLFVFRLLRLKRFSTLTLKVLNLFSRSRRKTKIGKRFSRNGETDLVCSLLLEKKKHILFKHEVGDFY